MLSRAGFLASAPSSQARQRGGLGDVALRGRRSEQACPASDKPGLAHALITKAALEVAAARLVTNSPGPPAPAPPPVPSQPVVMAPAQNGACCPGPGMLNV